MVEDLADQTRTRRRGAVLEQAIRDAVFAELSESGYAALNMEAVAARAGTGKAPLYRRWSNKRDMVVGAIDQALSTGAVLPEEDDQSPETGGLRAELMILLGSMASTMRSAPGRAMHALIEERHRHPELAQAVITHLIQPRLARLAVAIRRAVNRGEIPPPVSVELIARVGPAMVLQHELEHGQAPTTAEIADIVDLVVLPVLGTR
ncbi:TetR/AcrR family transcriptional regulator [Pseudonocardia adelaidensis]|uniref:TetR/AcrR family transcriptional regulator n=1 Tax=Pseudonocardia adelaidensis TaxID=648754 RepID=A0ABP9PBQ0_9PSEU